MLVNGQRFAMVLGDSIEKMAAIPPASFDFSVFSPPFPSLFSYSSSEADIGNSEDLNGDARLHLSFFYRQLARVVKPGRVIAVHVMQIPRMKRVDKKGGLIDFRGINIRIGERAGLIYEYDWAVRKNPQSQAIRTRSRELQFSGLESDRARSRGTLLDYIIKFRTQGENDVPVDSEGEVSRNNWIDYAEGCWNDIRETDTLNVRGTKGEGDTKHICPLQIGVVERLIRLYSNPDEIVFSPFAGIGTEIYTALKLGRRGYGIELKEEYHRTAIANCERALQIVHEESPRLFDLSEADDEETAEGKPEAPSRPARKRKTAETQRDVV